MSADHPESFGSRSDVARALNATLAWTAGVTGALLLVLIARRGLALPIWSWVEFLTSYVGAVLPFAAVAGGLSLARSPGRQGRAPAVTGLMVGVATYLVAALAMPLAEYASWMWGDGHWYGTTVEAFGIQTPDGILRNLKYVLENPPSEYSLSAEHPDRAYPNRLLLFLHLPMATAAVALLNTFVGLLLGRATGSMSVRAQRRTRWSVGLVGAAVLVAAIILAQGPNRDWANVSGIVAAWTPVLVPVCELAVLAWVVRRRSVLRVAPRGPYL